MENYFIILILFIFGTLFGSFLNVLIDRFSTDRSVVKGRSYCENCKKTLSWKELIPLLSFLFQKGKCVHCKAKIPARLFIVELLVGILMPVILYWGRFQGLNLLTIVSIFIIIYSFIGIIFADLKYGLIPDKFLIIAFLPVVYYVFANDLDIFSHLLSALGALGFFLFLFLATKGRGMGFGDVKLSFVIGLFLGHPLTLLALYLAFLTGAIISIILVLCKKVSFQKGTIPFGPFLLFSTIICYFYGDQFLIPFILRYI